MVAKVTIIGATGHVGRFAAYSISEIPHVTDMLLFGREGREEYLEGICEDFSDSFAARGRDLNLRCSTNPADIRGSDIVIITAGSPRHTGQDRMDLACENAMLVAETAAMVGRMAPESIILMVTNPVDVMTAIALKYSGMSPSRVLGLGTHLDSMRLKSLIARYFNVHVSEVHTRIIGEHGESMVPLWSATTIGGIRISNLPAFTNLPKDEMMDQVRTAGKNIIEKYGSTIYGPGDAIAVLVRTILGDENRILTVSGHIKSEIHGIGNVCIGVPARINRRGIFPVSITIEDDEREAFSRSSDRIRQVTAEVTERLSETQKKS